ncbi:uncharacterized protein GGS22DRAFT_188928 [Annulohypoxylon maeteangense]|uniref:uncharacterized protein n=1 Tax=Annulohypoxylon maeteangense TaxID=1927788 RepID=UPI00200836B8|nr:uncharacterized protein GGS22DRAFT_188928 [Annulohypoxylon maeteangense]KAI0884717.1 hypothetical protein GGS22DRAFT_188928 [Annulohypoxylon maeteangense]
MKRSREPLFQHLPAELIIKIYKSMNDIEDIKATLSTCRRAKAIFDAHASAIAKSHLLRKIHPSNLKLMVMAVASRDVDPEDPVSIERFFHKYIWHAADDVWPNSYFTMDMVALLPVFAGAAEQVWECAGANCFRRPFYFEQSPTEDARKLRVCLMIETATNLFYRAPGKDGVIFWRCPNAEWADRYWDAFSRVEVDMVVEVADFVAHVLLNSTGALPVKTTFRRRDFRQALWKFAFTIGLETLYRWHQVEPYSMPSLIEDTWESIPDGESMETPLDDATRCLENKTGLQPRFQPDPDAIDEEAWQFIKREGVRKFGNLIAQVPEQTMMSFWDKAALMKFCEAMRSYFLLGYLIPT